MTTATDTERDEALSQLADLTDTFGYESVRNMLDTLERNDIPETCEDRNYRCCEQLTPHEHKVLHGYTSASDDYYEGGN